jgi:Hint module
VLAAVNLALLITPGGDIVSGLKLLERAGPKLIELVAKYGPRAADFVGCALCFPAGTLVATPNGERPIEQLRVGDKVLAEDPATGKVEPEPVLAVLHDPVSALMEIRLSDGSSVRVTPDHVFGAWMAFRWSSAGWRSTSNGKRYRCNCRRVGTSRRNCAGLYVDCRNRPHILCGFSAGARPQYELAVSKSSR